MREEINGRQNLGGGGDGKKNKRCRSNRRQEEKGLVRTCSTRQYLVVPLTGA